MCNACDGEGVPELMRRSGKHPEDHHLIRCLAPEKDDNILSSTEQRLISLEDRMQSRMQSQFEHIQFQFDNMQSRFDNLQSRFNDLNQNLTSLIGNMERLLHKLAPASTSKRSA